ncbi:MAG TPA: 3-isopropylmalate dehydratase large subunit [Clostridia bacterium]|nr:3-isopropylmalate dehydratase large subunit [Clostridia bacterium]
MAMHAVHKILARASGTDSVKPGEVINAKIDIAGINDIYLTALKAYGEMGGKEVWDRDKVVFFFDHNAPSPSEIGAFNQREMRKFVNKNGVKHLFDINEGICHMVLPEAGLVKPGSLIVITDSHTTTHGAFGAFSTGVGSTDLATVMMTGEMWMRVPQVINVKLNGKLKDGIMAKDIAIFLLGELGTKVALYKALEFSGEIIDALSIEERMTICNMAVEMGAKTAYIKPDEKTIAYLRRYTDEEFYLDETDVDFEYENEYFYDLSNLEPQVAMPHSVDNRETLWDVEGIDIDQVFIGSCTGGKLVDIAAAAEILKGNKVAKGTRLVVTHASKRVLEKSIELGYYKILLEAGAAITTPGCGACLGGHSGILTDGENCAATSSRNFPGRMGSKNASIYLVSPATAAATAIAGRLTHPRTNNEELKIKGVIKNGINNKK